MTITPTPTPTPVATVGTPTAQAVGDQAETIGHDIGAVYIPALLTLVLLFFTLRAGVRWLRRAPWAAAPSSYGGGRWDEWDRDVMDRDDRDSWGK